MSPFRGQGSYSGFNFRMSFSGAVRILIIINICVFVLIHLVRNVPWFRLFALVPSLVFSRFMIWQLATYLFLHAGLWHLVLNMLMLWLFGSVLEGAWGSKKFLFFYFFTGIGAGLCSFIFAFQSPNPVLGASGAIFGLLVAYAVMFPESIILLFFIFPMKMKHAAIVLAGINLLGALSSPGSGVAYIAHLGGGVFGYLYLKSEWLQRQMSGFNLSNLKDSFARKRAFKKQNEINELNRQVDMILDKISKHGMDSITPKERKILQRKGKMN